MATAKNPFMEMDVTKMMGDFKMPTMDVEKLMTVQRKNVEALTNANQLAIEGMQAIARRQAEIMRQMIEETSQALKLMMEQGSPEERMAKQADLMKAGFEKTLANLRELGEMVAKSNREAFDVINVRVTQSLEELKGMMPATGGGAAPKKASAKAA
jgi:phasin family protein